MGRPLRILHLEDRPEDAELLRLTLEADGLDCRVELVSTRDTFETALAAGGFDLILSDFALPSFDGLTALRLASTTTPGTPFILVSGTIGEEAAIESLRGGATDYVLKHRLSRLGPAVRRALNEAHERIIRHAAEEALAREQSFLRAVLENMQTGIIACDDSGRLTLFNRAAREMHAVPEEAPLNELLGGYFQILEADGVTPIEFHELPLQRIIRGESVHDQELVVLPKRSAPRHLLASGRALVDDLGRRLGALVALQDITEQHRLTEELRQSQKMEAVGQLAGGVAHDFNNLLTVIMGYCQILQHRLSPGDPAVSDTEEILKASWRGATLTRQLLALGRRQVLEPRVLDLNLVSSEVEKMCGRLIGEDIQLVMVLGRDLGRVKADRGQLEQVLMNLVVNARDAMPAGGKVTIETSNVELGEDYTRTRVDLEPGRYILLQVSDTGCGMSPEVAARVFEPFYTTKEAGRGTGLGLSTVHGIIKQSGGYIEMLTEEGRGTTFKIYLPRVDGALDMVEAEPRVPHCDDGTETILLVEDDETIRRMMCQSLMTRGYVVIEAENGAEALAIGERRKATVDLLITDVVMPLLRGPELARRLVAKTPSLRVLFVSGHAGVAMVQEGVREEMTGFLQKPFLPDMLLRKVREVLDRPRQAAA